MTLEEKIDPKHTAIIVIDIQNDFASPDPKYFRANRKGDLSLVDPMIDQLEKVILIAQRAGVLVLYTQQIYDKNKLNDLQKEQYDLDGRAITCDVISDGYKFYRINPPENVVFPKYYLNIFSNLELKSLLESRGIKTLVITGMDIIFCVETAIRNGYDLGYKIVVPSDMVAGNAKVKEMNDRTLELVRKTFGVVTTAEELIRIWSKTPPQ